jgi:hypothetical protein
MLIMEFLFRLSHAYHLRVTYFFFVNKSFFKTIKSLINMMHNYPSHAYHGIFFGILMLIICV